jgi:hypothetical protein
MSEETWKRRSVPARSALRSPETRTGADPEELFLHADPENVEIGQSIRAVVAVAAVGMVLFTRDFTLFQACLYTR